MIKDKWNCFFCDKTRTYEFVVKPRDNWEVCLNSLLNKFPLELQRSLNADGSKKDIRVLSLFDGISTGLMLLDKVKIKVEVYYATEIVQDAINVSRKNHSTRVQQLGDVCKINEEEIRKIAPIDLLIGGSPCKAASIRNEKESKIQLERAACFVSSRESKDSLKSATRVASSFLHSKMLPPWSGSQEMS